MSESYSSLRRLYQHRELAWEMAVRELQAVYKGSLLGIGWLIAKPLIQSFAPLVLVSTAWNSGNEGRDPIQKAELAAYILAGMIPWQIMARVLEESTQLVHDRSDLVKQVKFPLETLPLMSLLTSLFGAGATLLLWLVMAGRQGLVSWTAVLLPVPLALLLVFVVGCGWGLMIAGAILRDIRNIVGLGMLVGGILPPISMTAKLASPKVWAVSLLNPLAHIVIAFRDVLYGEWHPVSWLIFVVLACSAWMIGGWVLRRNQLWINEFI